MAQVDDGLKQHKKQLLEQARRIVKSKHGWLPYYFIIDKSRAERSAIRKGI